MKTMVMSYLSILVGLIGCYPSARAQSPLKQSPINQQDTAFLPIIQHFNNTRREVRDTTRYELPTLFKSNYYNLNLADSALHWSKHIRTMQNPYGPEKYPLSYSVLYRGMLISLFSPGSFTCIDVNNWARNLNAEKQLNTRQFQYHWLIDGQLIGLSGERYWAFTTQDGWKLYKTSVPFGKRPKLFEDATYLAYSECKGEFGGTVFFYDKQTRKTHSAQAVCADWVYHTPEGYHVVSNLGHMVGSADERLITNPSLLSSAKQANSKAADSSTPKLLFDLFSVQLFGGFLLQNKVVYVTLVGDRTCLATLSGNAFTILDPLFNNRIYTHNPVSTTYSDVTVINLDFYGLGREREVQCLVIKNGHIELVQWM